MANELAIIPVSDMQIMAKAIVDSGLWNIKTPAQALALMLVAQAEGLHPATAARDYNIIQGRPALKADAMLARFQAAGGVVEWQEVTDTRVAGLFSHPHSCPRPVLIDWDMQRARQAQLGGKEMWSKYPRQMLRARVISEGIRTVYPGAIGGVYTPEEVRDFTDDEQQPQPAATYTLDRPALPAVTVDEPPATTQPMKRVYCQGGVVKQTRAKPDKPSRPYILYTLEMSDGGTLDAYCWSIEAAESWLASTHPETFAGDVLVDLETRADPKGRVLSTIKSMQLVDTALQANPADEEMPPPTDPTDPIFGTQALGDSLSPGD
jgi:hypothetical protein